jgi:hypothetical protein
MGYKHSLFISSIILLLFSFGCGQKTSNENNDTLDNEGIPAEVQIEKSLYDDVMLVHDEVMPRMEDMMNLKGQLTEKVDLMKEESGNVETIQEIETAISQLEAADDVMMNWMRNFDPNIESLSHEEIVTYYTNQKSAIDSVKMVMETAISRASELVNSDQ